MRTFSLLAALFVTFMMFSLQAKAQSIPPASDWSASNVITLNRNSPEPTMAVIDIATGVLLSYDAPTGGINVGTSGRQYNFVTNASVSSILTFDLSIDAINGTFNNSLTLEILHNGNVVSTLDSTTANTYTADFPNQSLDLSAGDSWGIRATAGNFSQSTGTSSEILVTSIENQVRYDVADDWSDIQNPNGVWTYAGDSGALLTINQTDWDPGNIFFSSQQQAWADAIFPTPGHVPMWFRTSGPSALDVTGVGMHGSEGGNVAWVGVVWTSPTDGTINIDGGVWHAFKAIDSFGSDHRVRNSDWRLRLNNTVLASGNVSGTDGFSSASPFAFSAGSNGTSLSDIPIVAGDDLVLEFISPTSFATFIGIDFVVTLNHPTPVSTPQCDIQLNQANYVDGETVTANVFRFANPTGVPVATEIKCWLGVPGVPPIPVINVGADGSVVFPAGMDIDYGPIPLFPVTGLPRGSYELSCRLLDPVTGELLCEDRNFFDIQ